MAIFYIFTNPRILSKLRAEIADARPTSPIRDVEARNMPYLQAVLKETLRICPPITGIILKDVPPEGDVWNGKPIPPGTVIGFSVMGVSMNKAIWGEDAAAFRPERFLEGSANELRQRDAIADTAFGFGRWRCLGRNIALIEMNKAVTEVRLSLCFSHFLSSIHEVTMARPWQLTQATGLDRPHIRPQHRQPNGAVQELQRRRPGAVGYVLQGHVRRAKALVVVVAQSA